MVMGDVIQAGSKMKPAPQAAINGAPVDASAMTVNRVCGSGAQAIAWAAQEIWLGYTDAAIAGGMKNIDTAPYLMSGGRWGCRTDLRQHDARRLKRGVVTPLRRRRPRDRARARSPRAEDGQGWRAHDSQIVKR